MPTFREPCSPLHQGEEQSDTELFLRAVPLYITFPFYIKLLVGMERPGGTAQYQTAPRPNEVDCKVHETSTFQEWI
ncbi:hypothetical protein ALC57_00595 [Trachymyrmex cornetzi]|uniref:Uncharacterized protein n=1 Tax=Trachymyrmex cornetzi TaxID=471704 RepID=A0A151JRF1_9HYME|nr:hypothetical protein ALC57_00595 [Trachymyrmex cornetzi]